MRYHSSFTENQDSFWARMTGTQVAGEVQDMSVSGHAEAVRYWHCCKRVLVNGLMALGLSGAIAGAAWAQSGEVSGSLGGQSFEYAISGDVVGYPAAMTDFASDGVQTEFDVSIFALEPDAQSVKGALVFMRVQAEGDLDIGQLRPGMPADFMVMLVDKWEQGEADPATVWLALSEEASTVKLQTLDLSEEGGLIQGQIISDFFCLHDSSSGDPEPVQRNGERICKSGDIRFNLTVEDSQAMAAQSVPDRGVEVEVLGQLEGTVGSDSYQWMTILPKQSTEGTATFSNIGNQVGYIDLQGYSPDSEKFLSQDVLTIALLETTANPFHLNKPIPAEVAFIVDGSSLMYTAQDGEGHAEATLTALDIDGDLGTVSLEVRGQLCRVENFKLVANDCLPFEVKGHSEIMLESME